MKFSIIIITYNRKKELLECLETIKSQCIQYPYEVIIIFNGETSYLEKTRLNYPQFKCTSISRTTPGAARNSAIKYATGEYFFFLDDDCLLPKNYFDQVKFDQGWDILGGPDKTPPISSQLQQNIGKALASPLCMGPTYRRHHQSKDYLVNANEESLILCNLWFQASNFHEGYRFNEKIFRNEENLLLKELKRDGKKLHYNPLLFVFHKRKDNLEKLSTAIVKSGECRVQNIAILPTPKEIIYFLPLGFISFFVFTFFFSYPSFIIFFLGYFFIVSAYCIYIYKEFNISFIALHFFIMASYGVGLLKGCLITIQNRYNSFKENRSLINESKSK